MPGGCCWMPSCRRYALGCGEIVGEVGGLCASCWQSFNFVSAPHCACCGTPFVEDLGPEALCAGCMARRPRYNRARAALIYDDHSRRLILPFKHGDRTDIARACGGWMARAGAELLASADLVAPVPLHWRRLFTRRWQSGGPARSYRRAGADPRHQGTPGTGSTPSRTLDRLADRPACPRTSAQRSRSVRRPPSLAD